MSLRTLPTKHLSARVPWQDNKWNGTVCNNPIDNSFCRILTRIDSMKDSDFEDTLKSKLIDDHIQPPCINEKGTFLSPNAYIRESKHAWRDINKLYKDFLPCKIIHKSFSFNAVPFLWMMKNRASESPAHYSQNAEIYGLDYDSELEAEIDEKLGFEGNKWIQHPNNQKAMLDGFFGCLKPNKSLVFFYAKHTPFSEPNSRVIIGAAKISSIGDLLEYNYPTDYSGHRGYVWDRIVTHSYTDKKKDGIILPYHEILEYLDKEDIEIDLNTLVAHAPDFKQFSFASELVEHDTAIDSLLAMAEQLKQASKLLGESFKKELDWIDNEISKIWDMRGAFPGMGPVLSAKGISNGNIISWEIEKYILNKDGDLYKTDPWYIFEESISDPSKHLGKKGAEIFDKTSRSIWNHIAPKTKLLIKLLSRTQLNNEQAVFLLNNVKSLVSKVTDILENPYLIFEKTRFNIDGFSFKQIDKAVLPTKKIREIFPLDTPSLVEDQLDIRRIRAIAVSVLEQAALEGHSTLPFSDFLDRLQSTKLETPLPLTDDVLASLLRDELVQNELNVIWDTEVEEVLFVKLKRLVVVKNLILQKIDIDSAIQQTYKIEKEWIKLVDNYPEFKERDKINPLDEIEKLARQEKAEALKILCNYKVSVLIGPAGSGKTTLLKIFQAIPEIKRGGVLKLAPTGKARVKLGHDAKTVAQYLYPERYDIAMGLYLLNDEAPKDSSVENIIIDEASMLTEEALAAVFDKLGFVKRIILVGDYRQLPPIGTGRPFVDLVNKVKPTSFKNNIIAGPCYAELKQIRRQYLSSEVRPDIILSRCFGDEIDKFDLEKFREISNENFKSNFLRFEKWYDTKDFRQLFDKVIREELELSEDTPEKDFNRTLGAVDSGDYQYFNLDEAEKVIENWQIITPNNGFAHGVKEVNKFIQTTYRKTFIELALNSKPEDQSYYNARKIAKPKGSDNYVYGDKVINLSNTNWHSYQWIKPKEKKEEALNYIANGEIGIVTGEFRSKKLLSYLKEKKKRGEKVQGEPNVEIAFSTQPGYSYVFWANSLDEEGNYPIDLAYAITIHKSQGSGFKKVFLILPAKGQALSRELFYTALTRQEDKIIILHQGPFGDFLKYASPLASSTSRRFTDLFFYPTIKEINKKYYDPKYINVSERGERMISKSEVIIANCLNKYKKEITYSYEDKLKLDSYEKKIKPDFKIQNLQNGKVYYWEHCGMMTLQFYREKWEKKLESYKKDGFVDFRIAKSDDKKILIITEDTIEGGVDSQYFDSIVKNYILGKT